MEPNESTEGSPSRSLDIQPCAEELRTVSEPFLSSHGHASALASATTAADAAASAAAAAASARAAAFFTETPAPYSRFTEPSSDNFLGAVYAGTPQIGRESLGFDPDYVSSTARHPYTTTDLSSSAAPVPGFSSDPLTGSSSSPVPGPGFRGYSSFPGSSSVPDHGLVPSSGTGPGSGSSPGFLTGPGPGTILPSGPGTILPSGPGTILPSGPGTIPPSGPGTIPPSGPATIPPSGLATIPCSGLATIPRSDTGRGHTSGQGFSPASGTDPASGAGPGSSSGPEPRPSTPQRFKNLRPDLFPNYTSWNQYCHWDPQKQPPWESLQVSEPGTRGLWKTQEDEGKPKFLYETMPRGQCLLYNWEEERATNHLDQVPNWQDISESFFFRHGHQGLLTTQPPSPMPSSTTQKDSYQPPRNLSQPLQGVKHDSQNEPIRQRKKEEGISGGTVDCVMDIRAKSKIPVPFPKFVSFSFLIFGACFVITLPLHPPTGKREAMVEMLLHHQICKEVQADLEPIKKPFKAESVTHHDYRMELMQGGPPAPMKPHDYRQEQPESFWIQRAPQLPGVSNIRTLDTPFRKNCSFSTPVPLSLGQPLPYELENYPHQLGEMSSLACQREGQGHPGGRMGPV
uniref:Sperm associated antigen 8 n=1 Tax=Urocitellus parryii TaxID=9999 RepID=A0A8D2I3W6_UROPR|nr:sperm-associated antigen 8 [Urocitellus parryii]